MWLSGLRTSLVTMRMRTPSLDSLSGLRSGIVVSCGIGHRCGSDVALLWLWRRLVATALIRTLAWELPYASGAALKKKKIIIIIMVQRKIIYYRRLRSLFCHCFPLVVLKMKLSG